MGHPPQYWVLGVYFAAVLALTATILALSHVLGERHSARATVEPFESGIVAAARESAHVRFPIQFYLVAMFFVVFDLESVFIYAWAVAGAPPHGEMPAGQGGTPRAARCAGRRSPRVPPSGSCSASSSPSW